jgi:hypothetical protein
LICNRGRPASVRPDVTTRTAPLEPGDSGEAGQAAKPPKSNGSGDPAWIYALAGWLIALTQLDRDRRGPTEAEIRERLPFGALGELDGDPDTMSLRGLRRLPAIGPARALAIARARWEEGLTGGPEAWDAIRGIGPETVAAIRRHLDAAAKEGLGGPSRSTVQRPAHETGGRPARAAAGSAAQGAEGSSAEGEGGNSVLGGPGTRVRGAQPGADSGLSP